MKTNVLGTRCNDILICAEKNIQWKVFRGHFGEQKVANLGIYFVDSCGYLS